MEEIKTIKELNGDADYNVIKGKPEAERVKFPIEHFDAFVLYMRNLFLQKAPMLEDGLEELQTWRQNQTAVTKENIGMGEYPSNPIELPVQTVVAQKFDEKADFVDPEPTILERVGSTYTLDFDPAKPVYRINLSATGTVQINGLNGKTSGTCLLYVKKVVGAATLAFRDINTPLEPFLIGTARTNNGDVDEYEIKKIDTRYYITQTPIGLGTEEPVATPVTNAVNFSAIQQPDENGKNVVLVHWDAVPGAQYKLVRNTNPTATSPTLYESTTYPTGGNYKDLGTSSGSSTTVLQTGITYYYRLRVTFSGQPSTWYDANPVKIQ